MKLKNYAYRVFILPAHYFIIRILHFLKFYFQPNFPNFVERRERESESIHWTIIIIYSHIFVLIWYI